MRLRLEAMATLFLGVFALGVLAVCSSPSPPPTDDQAAITAAPPTPALAAPPHQPATPPPGALLASPSLPSSTASATPLPRSCVVLAKTPSYLRKRALLL